MRFLPKFPCLKPCLKDTTYNKTMLEISALLAYIYIHGIDKIWTQVPGITFLQLKMYTRLQSGFDTREWDALNEQRKWAWRTALTALHGRWIQNFQWNRQVNHNQQGQVLHRRWDGDGPTCTAGGIHGNRESRTGSQQGAAWPYSDPAKQR